MFACVCVCACVSNSDHIVNNKERKKEGKKERRKERTTVQKLESGFVEGCTDECADEKEMLFLHYKAAAYTFPLINIIFLLYSVSVERKSSITSGSKRRKRGKRSVVRSN